MLLCQSGACLGSSVGRVWGLSGASLGQPNLVCGRLQSGAPVWGQPGTSQSARPPLWVKSGATRGFERTEVKQGVGLWGQSRLDRPRSGSVLSGASLGLVWGGPLGPVWGTSLHLVGASHYILASRPLRTSETIPGGAAGGATGGTTGGTATGEGTTGGTTQGGPAMLMKVRRHDTLAPRCTRKQSVGGR
jgi:hypothetical protein